MAYCTRCGTAINNDVMFCPNCGAAASSGPPPPPPNAPQGGAYQPPYQQVPYQQVPPNQQPPYPPYVGAPATSGMQENVAGLLCYLGWWVTGIIFLLIDKRPTVRFHAAQSIVMFGALTVIRILLAIVFSGSWYYGFGALYWLVFTAFDFLWFAAWVVLMVMAYQGKKFEIPVISDLARSLVAKA